MTADVARRIAERLFSTKDGDQGGGLIITLTRLRSELELENMGGWRKEQVVAVILDECSKEETQ